MPLNRANGARRVFPRKSRKRAFYAFFGFLDGKGAEFSKFELRGYGTDERTPIRAYAYASIGNACQVKKPQDLRLLPGGTPTSLKHGGAPLRAGGKGKGVPARRLAPGSLLISRG